MEGHECLLASNVFLEPPRSTSQVGRSVYGGASSTAQSLRIFCSFFAFRLSSHFFTGPGFFDELSDFDRIAVSYDGGPIGAVYWDWTSRTGPPYTSPCILPTPKGSVPPSPGRTYFCSSAQSFNDWRRSSGVMSSTRFAFCGILNLTVAKDRIRWALREGYEYDMTITATSRLTRHVPLMGHEVTADHHCLANQQQVACMRAGMDFAVLDECSPTLF